jgi:hypothetical protein
VLQSKWSAAASFYIWVGRSGGADASVAASHLLQFANPNQTITGMRPRSLELPLTADRSTKGLKECKRMRYLTISHECPETVKLGDGDGELVSDSADNVQ